MNSVELIIDGEPVLLDADIAEKYNSSNLAIDSIGYLRVKRERKRLHRILLEPIPKGLMVDHINNNKLDNRLSNLRLVTHAQNMMNTKIKKHNSSGFKGVYLCKQTNRWRAEIRAHNRAIKIGRFDTKFEAAKAYDLAALKYHGEFASLNFGNRGGCE